MREIAATAGVDSALIFSYFGDKQRLLHAVLSRSVKPIELFNGDADEVSAAIAAMLVGGLAEAPNAEFLLIMLRSVSDPQAAETIQQLSREHVYLPLAKILGSPDALVRATLLSAILLGFTAMHAIGTDFPLSSKDCRRLEDLVRTILHGIIAQDTIVREREKPTMRSTRSNRPRTPPPSSRKNLKTR